MIEIITKYRVENDPQKRITIVIGESANKFVTIEKFIYFLEIVYNRVNLDIKDVHLGKLIEF